MEMDFRKIQNDSIEFWSKAVCKDFKNEISSLNFDRTFYSKISDKKNYFELGCFNFIYDLCSNVHIPSNLSLEKPKKEGSSYFEYQFCKETLKIVKHFHNNRLTILLYISDDCVFQLTSNYELSCVWRIFDNHQIKIVQNGIYVDYIEKIQINIYKLISCDLFSFSESYFEYKDGYFKQVKIINKILKQYDEITKMNESVNPFPFNENFIKNGILQLKNGGYHER